MKALSPPAVRDVLLLSIAAGSADAAGYIELGRAFTSNMTGNVVLLGIAIGQGHLGDAARSLFVLAVFMLGVALGVRLGHGVDEKNWPRLAARLIGLEKIALLLFAAGWTVLPRSSEPVAYVLLALLAVAMGLQSAALNRLNAPGVGTTAITSTIAALVTGLVSLTVPGAERASASRIGFQAGVIVLYCLGAATSGILIIFAPGLAGWLPFTAAVLISPGSED